MTRLEALLQRLYQAFPKEIDLALERKLRLLDTLGNPHRALPPVVHVAGTNGKGSLIAYLRAMLTAAGYSAHVYTSPHLVRFHERIVLAGKEIGEDALIHYLERVAALIDSHAITFFEATTAAAFLAFRDTPADIVLLETGMGGRLDSTNVIERPLLTAITPVSFDHQHFLGNTLTAIAGEKAGILKPRVPCVVGPQEAEALEAIRRGAAARNAPLYVAGEDWREENGVYRSAGLHLVMPAPSLPGAHQYRNAATAIACAEKLPGFALSEEAMRQGIASAVWPARLQKLDAPRWLALLPEGSELFLDGGHNPAAAEALAAHFSGRRIALVAAMLQGKDAEAFFRPLAPLAESCHCIPIRDEPKALFPQDLAEAARRAGITQAAPASSLEEALASIGGRGRKTTVLIAGSLYLAGQLLAELTP